MSGRQSKAFRRAHVRVGARRAVPLLSAVPLLMAATLAPFLAPLPASALPEGGVVAAGAATVSAPTAASMQITQATDRLVMDWTRFNIAANEAVRFQQPSAASIALNRVLSHEPSHIFGALSANGQVILSNPGGILFGPTARVDVGALLATTATITTQDFLNGTYRFVQNPGVANAAVLNQGLITAGTGGYVALLGAAVRNEGVIQAQLGSVVLGAAKAATLDMRGDGLIGFVLSERVAGAVTGPTGESLATGVSNRGLLQADGGLVTMQAAVAADLVRATLNQEGVVRARTVESRAGRIFLTAGDHRSPSPLEGEGQGEGGLTGGTGLVSVSGTLDASGPKGDSPPSSMGTVPLLGGTVQVMGDVVLQTGAIHADGSSGGLVAIQARNVFSAGRVSADGATGAGGSVTVTASGRLLQTSAAHLSADGTGGGGTVTLQAAERVFGSGTLTATGQGAGATGGGIKVLGNEIVLLGARINASGDAGGGTVLVGGDYRGANPAVPNARTTDINFSTTLNADATARGDGGRVIVWADDQTQFSGQIFARGGAFLGDGGFIEVSGKERLVFGGLAEAGAPNGKPGTLLLDPKNIVIDANASTGLGVFQLVDPNPGAGDKFAAHIVGLSNNNVVATDPNDDFAAVNAGAVYLYNGATGALISTLTGSSVGNEVGFAGVTALANGNYVVRSSRWDNGAVVNVGAVTFGNGTSGVSGVVSAANSLVGTTADDQIGGTGVTALANGNYVVHSLDWDNGGVRNVGAVTFGNGTSGVSGVVSAANSLVGSTRFDSVGRDGVTALANGNYVVASPIWDNGAVRNAGAVTFGNGTTGISGTISSTNSLVGTTADGFVGYGGVTALTNGNYVVYSPNWDNGTVVNAGAVTFGNGTSGVSGLVSAANSLVGSTRFDSVGSDGVTALANGNYVVASSRWDNGVERDAGAVTFGNGTTGISGTISSTNSLVGTVANDQVGSNGVTALTNGNYVVRSIVWGGDTKIQAGAVTFGIGTSGVSGVVSEANSLVGTRSGDRIGFDGVTALTNGNYVVASSRWNNGVIEFAGAVTFGNGASGVSGLVSAANSLVGTQAVDTVGIGGVTALTNGNYVVHSPYWDNGAVRDAGAVTFGSGTSGVSGLVSAANSLVGTTAFDEVGDGVVTALTNGNYVVSSPFWDNGAVVNAGAVTFGSGTSGVSGPVSATNSLVGTTARDGIGGVIVFRDIDVQFAPRDGVTALANGNYVVASSRWDNGTVVNAGAVTFGSGTSGVSGVVSEANSLVGRTANDHVGSDQLGNSGVTALTNGNYVVRSFFWDNDAADQAGAVTFGNGASGISGTISSTNSLVGTTALAQIGSGGISEMPNGKVIVRSPNTNKGAIMDAGLVHVVVPPPAASGQTFASNAGGNVTITPAQITAITNSGAAVVLQANNDITVNAAVNVNNPAGNGGHLTLQAGRSILINSTITTDNGNLTLIANESFPPAASGLVAAQREAGQAAITLSAGSALNVGAGLLTRLVRGETAPAPPASAPAPLTRTVTQVLRARVFDAQTGILNLSPRGQQAATLLSFGSLPPDLVTAGPSTITVRGEGGGPTGRQGRFWGDLAGPGKVTIKK